MRRGCPPSIVLSCGDLLPTGHIRPGAKIVLADCGLSDDAKALAACLADRGKDVVLVDGAKFHVE